MEIDNKAIKTESTDVSSGAKVWTRGKKWLIGLNAVAMILIATGILVGVNYLGQRYYTRWDCTFSQEYTLSDKTQKVLNSLEEPITIYTLFMSMPGPQAQLISVVQSKLSDLLEEYEFASAKVMVDEVKIMETPERLEILKKKLDTENLMPNDIVIVCGERQKIINIGETFEPERQGYGPPKGMKFFRGEEAITGAILNVLQESKPTIYFVQGHGEADIYDIEGDGIATVSMMIRRENIDVKKISLLKEQKIPEDCDLLVMIGPKKAVVLEEQNLINDHLNKGGSFLVMIDPMSRSGLEKLLADWGVALDDNAVIDEENCRLYLGIKNLIWIMTNSYGRGHPISRGMTPDIITTLPGVRSMEPIKEPSKTFNIVSILDSTPTAWGATDLDAIVKGKVPEFIKGVDKKGPLCLALAVAKLVAGETPPEGVVISQPVRMSRLVVIGDSDMIKNKHIDPTSLVGFCRIDLFMNSMRWLIQQEQLISIEPKQPEDRHIYLDTKRLRILLLVCLVGLPLLGILLGIGVWILRRK